MKAKRNGKTVKGGKGKSFTQQAAEGDKFLAQFPAKVLEQADKAEDGLDGIKVLIQFWWDQLPKPVQDMARESGRPLEFVENLRNYCVARQSKTTAEDVLPQRALSRMHEARKRLDEATAKLDVKRMLQAMDDAVFAGLKFSNWAPLSDPNLKQFIVFRVQEACEKNDASFLIKLGRTLGARQEFEYDRLSKFLVDRWAGVGDEPGLCFFTDEALVELCRLCLKRAVTLDAVRKTRQRLGLKKAGQPCITTVELVEGKIVVS